MKFRVCETPSVLTKVPCSSHDMDAHPFTRVMSGLTKGWAAVRDLSHREKGIGCLSGDLVGEAAINNIYIYMEIYHTSIYIYMEIYHTSIYIYIHTWRYTILIAKKEKGFSWLSLPSGKR